MVLSDEKKETHTSSSWGYGAGIDANIGIEGGYKDGHATLGAKKHLGVSVEGQKENSQKDLYHAEPAAPPPNNFGSGVGYPNGMPNPANGAPYYTQYALPPPGMQFAPQWPQYARQQTLQFTPQYYDYVPQYAYAPQNTPQYIPQGAPQYAPQNVQQYAPQNVPQYAPQNVPQNAPQNVPQYSPRRAPPCATSNRAPDSSQQTINEECVY